MGILTGSALSLINHQKAEIERLQTLLDEVTYDYNVAIESAQRWYTVATTVGDNNAKN
jgi:hypothetical protein